jgi:hypothetical protein
LSFHPEEIKNLTIGLGVGLGNVVGKSDVEDTGEKLFYAQAAKNFQGMGAVAAGENSFVEGDGLQKLSESRVNGELFFHPYVMDIFEVIFGVDILVDHQAPEGRTILPDVFLSELTGQVFFKTHAVFHVIPDPLDNHLEDAQRFWIKGIVDIKKDTLQHILSLHYPFDHLQGMIDVFERNIQVGDATDARFGRGVNEDPLSP